MYKVHYNHTHLLSRTFSRNPHLFCPHIHNPLQNNAISRASFFEITPNLPGINHPKPPQKSPTFSHILNKIRTKNTTCFFFQQSKTDLFARIADNSPQNTHISFHNSHKHTNFHFFLVWEFGDSFKTVLDKVLPIIETIERECVRRFAPHTHIASKLVDFSQITISNDATLYK